MSEHEGRLKEAIYFILSVLAAHQAHSAVNFETMIQRVPIPKYFHKTDLPHSWIISPEYTSNRNQTQKNSTETENKLYYEQNIKKVYLTNTKYETLDFIGTWNITLRFRFQPPNR